MQAAREGYDLRTTGKSAHLTLVKDGRRLVTFALSPAKNTKKVDMNMAARIRKAMRHGVEQDS